MRILYVSLALLVTSVNAGTTGMIATRDFVVLWMDKLIFARSGTGLQGVNDSQNVKHPLSNAGNYFSGALMSNIADYVTKHKDGLLKNNNAPSNGAFEHTISPLRQLYFQRN